MIKLYYHPKGCACGCDGESNKPVLLATKADKEIVQSIYATGVVSINDKLLQRYAGGFDRAVTSVFNAGRQYTELERELRINASRFGTYKAYDLEKKLEKLRASGVSEKEFKKQAELIVGAYNGYQRTEYNTLVSRARSAKQLKQFASEKALYPNIEWLLTTSAHPRELHRTYVGLVLPQGDPFWNNNQPGNEWGCKCNWRTTDKPVTNKPSQTLPPAIGLEGNPAATGELVTDNHPYFKRNKNAPKWVENKAILSTPDAVAYTVKETNNGSYLEHLLASDAAEVLENEKIARILLAFGYKDIKLLPQIHKNEVAMRVRYYGNSFNNAHPSVCPDAMIGSTPVEFKHTNFGNMSKRIKEASKKSNIAILRVEQPLKQDYLDRFIKGQWNLNDRENLKEIVIINAGTMHQFKRP